MNPKSVQLSACSTISRHSLLHARTQSPARAGSHAPFLNPSSARRRPSCVMSPWMATTLWPLRASVCSSRGASFLYSTKMRQRFLPL